MRHLDTNIIIAYLNGNQVVATRLKAHLPDIAMSSLVVAELLYGARASAQVERNVKRIEEFMRLADVAVFDRSCAEAYSHLRLSLRQQGQPPGEVDALIAAVALAHKAILVTHNVRHFAHIPGWQLED